MMIRSSARSQLLMLAQVLTEEAQQWPRRSQSRSNLTSASLQLARLAKTVNHPAGDADPAVIEAYLAEATVLVSRLAAARAFKEQPWS